jgi:hypothetical protein
VTSIDLVQAEPLKIMFLLMATAADFEQVATTRREIGLVILTAPSECCATLLDQPLELVAHLLAWRLLSFEALLQGIYVINLRAYLHEWRRIADARPTGDEISSDKANPKQKSLKKDEQQEAG